MNDLVGLSRPLRVAGLPHMILDATPGQYVEPPKRKVRRCECGHPVVKHQPDELRCCGADGCYCLALRIVVS